MRTSGEVAQLVGFDRSTISNWCKEFHMYLSPIATPSDGSHRRFNQEDLSVIMLIASMKKMGSTYEEIHASLQNGSRITPPEDNRLTLPGNISTQIALLEDQIADLQEELTAAKADANRKAGRVELLEEMLEEERKRVEKLLAVLVRHNLKED